MADREACQKLFDFLNFHPENHDQSQWAAEVDVPNDQDIVDPDNVCGTSMCAAGGAAFLAGRLTYAKHYVGASASRWIPLVDGKIHADTYPDWDMLGAELLGLDEIEASWMFHEASNDEVLHALKAYANGEEFEDFFAEDGEFVLNSSD